MLPIQEMSEEALKALEAARAHEVAVAQAGNIVYAGIGAGLAAIGAGLGIGKIGGAANEAIARQKKSSPVRLMPAGGHLPDHPYIPASRNHTCS